MDPDAPIRAKFKPTPDGQYHSGIPARDLTQEDYLALDTAQRKTVRMSPIYSYVMAKDMPGRQPDAEDDEPEPLTNEPDDPVTEEPAIAAEEGETS